MLAYPRIAVFCLGVPLVYFLGGCTSGAKAERAAELTATGQATIENYASPALKSTRVFVIHIDGVLLQTSGTRGVFPLTPGRHVLHVVCHFSRPTIGDLVIDAADAHIELDAVSGVRYRLAGRKVNRDSAELWIEDAATGKEVVSRLTVPLTANPQNVPLVIPIPAIR